MAVTTCVSANAVKRNGNAATMVNVGTPGDPVNSNITLRTLAVNGPKITHVQRAVSAASSGNLGTIRPYTAGTFAYMQRNQYIMQLSGKYISGVATNIFLGGSNKVNQRAWNKQTTQHTSYLYSLTWTASRNGQPVYTKTVNNQTDTFGADEATLDIGELVYRSGKPLPIQADYPTKTSN